MTRSFAELFPHGQQQRTALAMVERMERGAYIEGERWQRGDAHQARQLYRWAFDPTHYMYSDDHEWQESCVRGIQRRFAGD